MPKKILYRFVFNRKNKLNGHGKALIQLRLTKSSTQKYISTGVYITPKCWDEKKQEVKQVPNKIEINKYLSDFKSKIEAEEFKQIQQGNELDFNRLTEILNDTPDGDFIKFFEVEAWNSGRTDSTISNYNTCLSHIKRHGKIKSYADITYNNILDFDHYLKKKGLSKSTVHKQHKVLKLFIKKATDKGILKFEKNPYLRFKPDAPEPTDRKYLTAEELSKIESKDFEICRIARVRDMFILSCYTGIGFKDLESFTKEDIEFEDDVEWITNKRIKTNSYYTVPVFPKAKAILERYDYVLPIITNQRTNAYLKEIADLCGIKKRLTFHMARHTFATTVTLSNDVPIETVSKMLGHSNIKTTQIYAKILKHKILNDTKKLM